MTSGGGATSGRLNAAVLNFNSYGANSAWPETAAAEFVTRTKQFVNGGRPASPAVNVSVSFAADQLKVPLTNGLMRKAACTRFVSIGWLNRRTTGDHVGTFAASCAGELPVTTGSSGSRCACAMKILAVVGGTASGGVCEPAATAMVSSGSSRFTSTVPGA